MAKKVQIMVALIACTVIGAIFASSASAECGPGFSNKQQLIQYYKHNPSAAQGLRKELLAHSAYTGYHADETVLNYLRSPEQKVFATPSGYVLNKNTYCPGGPGKYQPYNGLLTNMPGKPMLWHCNKDGKCVPLLKGYCMNWVMGPPVVKHPPKKHHPPKKCKCKKQKPPKKQCTVKSGHANGNCLKQTNTATAEQECKGQVSGTQCVITQTQINNVCGNVNVGGSDVNQGGNCNTGGEETCVGQNNCNTTPPPPPACPCKPEEPKKPEPPVVKWETIQEIWLGHSRSICVAVTPPSGVSVHIDAEWGEVKNGGNAVLLSGTNKYCATYVAPTEKPPHTCVEPISNELPSGTKCDIVEAVVVSSNGAKTVTVKKEIPIIQEDESVTW
jgi:hypothetical protein